MPRRRPPGGVAVGARERRSVGRVDLRLCRGRRPPGGAAVGASERRSVGREDLRRAACGGHLEVLQWARANGARGTSGLAPCRGRRPPGGAAVGASERRSVEQETCAAAEGGHLEVLQWARANGAPWDELTCSNAALRPPGGAAVGARERRSVGRGTCAEAAKAATWRCCSGRERTALRGTRGLAPKPRKAATWRCCSGRETTALRGTRRLAWKPCVAATWRC